MDSDPEAPSLSLDALRLLAPPLRLISAAVWTAVRRRDVVHYGKVADLVTAVRETTPDLLTYRHTAKLTLGLRARVIVGMLVSGAPLEEISSELDKFVPPKSQPSANGAVKKDRKVQQSVQNFRQLVSTLLDEPLLRQQFIQDSLPVQYGDEFDTALERLVWEFIVRLDQLLPVPSLKQTVSLLSAAPCVWEDSLRLAQPQLLHNLLQHHRELGHLEQLSHSPGGPTPSHSTGDLYDSQGDSILSSLSSFVQQPNTEGNELGPSPVYTSTHWPDTAANRRADDSQAPPATRTRSKATPSQSSARKRAVTVSRALTGDRERRGSQEKGVRRRGGEVGETGVRRRSARQRVCASEGRIGRERGCRSVERRGEEKERGAMFYWSDKGRGRRREAGKVRWKDRGRQSQSERRATRSSQRAGLGDSAGVQEGVGPLDLKARFLVTSCLHSQPRVVIRRLSFPTPPLPVSTPQHSPVKLDDPPASRRQEEETPVRRVVTRKRKLSAPLTISPRRRALMSSLGSGEKENYTDVLEETGSVSPAISPVKTQPARPLLSIEPTDDIILDSEDEETKNFKCKLFTEQYHRTKYNTFIPTLREFLQPGLGDRTVAC
ncbi:TERF1-interacting nuclear factor 2 [Amia ocellicauda]|uniref:TERF1-interacting nuclear factor 2 n=1 Tax=Amia ocellicauda TaxID=2972642 RepID=UPI003464126A